MIIYLAGNGRKVENSPKILEQQNDNWGVLLSYKDEKTKTKKVTSRFRNLIKRKK